ncbi:hypothetical protein EBX31_02205 [bacterium]|nr:hypothetical protein [bacterium]
MKEEEKRGWRVRLSRAWWLFLGRCGVPLPRRKLEELHGLFQGGKEDEAIKLFHEIGGTVEKVNEPIPPWSELGDTWDEVDGEIWNVEPCYHGGRSVYVGNIFKDPIIRGKKNPYFRDIKNNKKLLISYSQSLNKTT